MRKLMVLLGMSLLLAVLACSAGDGFSEDALASKPTAGQDDGGFLENLNSSGVDEGQQANMTV